MEIERQLQGFYGNAYGGLIDQVNRLKPYMTEPGLSMSELVERAPYRGGLDYRTFRQLMQEHAPRALGLYAERLESWVPDVHHAATQNASRKVKPGDISEVIMRECRELAHRQTERHSRTREIVRRRTRNRNAFTY